MKKGKKTMNYAERGEQLLNDIKLQIQFEENTGSKVIGIIIKKDSFVSSCWTELYNLPVTYEFITGLFKLKTETKVKNSVKRIQTKMKRDSDNRNGQMRFD